MLARQDIQQLGSYKAVKPCVVQARYTTGYSAAGHTTIRQASTAGYTTIRRASAVGYTKIRQASAAGYTTIRLARQDIRVGSDIAIYGKYKSSLPDRYSI